MNEASKLKNARAKYFVIAKQHNPDNKIFPSLKLTKKEKSKSKYFFKKRICREQLRAMERLVPKARIAKP